MENKSTAPKSCIFIITTNARPEGTENIIAGNLVALDLKRPVQMLVGVYSADPETRPLTGIIEETQNVFSKRPWLNSEERVAAIRKFLADNGLQPLEVVKVYIPIAGGQMG